MHSKINQLTQKSVLNDDQEYQDHQSIIKWGVKCLVLVLFIFIVWAALAPLDEGVPVNGTVSVESRSKAVQHLSGGIVSAILVKEGQEVHLGDRLLTLDNVNLSAKFNELKQHYLSFRAQESRLMAEKNKQTNIQFHEDLNKESTNPIVQQLMMSQSQLLLSKSAALASQLNAKQEFIAGQKAIIEGSRGQLSSIQVQIDLLDTQLTGMRELVNDGYMAKNQLVELEQKVVQLHGQKALIQSDMIKSQKQILEAMQQITLVKQTQNKENDTELQQVRLYIQADTERMKSLQDELNRTAVLSPATGQVVGLQVHTIGAVIGPGQKILDIVPEGEPYIIDAKIQPHIIDKIRNQQLVDIRFSGFTNSPLLVVEGQIKTISKDILTQVEPSGMQQSYYLARISITKEGLKTLGNRTLQPGMPVEVIIKTGERTMLNYWLHPLLKRLAASMKEE